MQLAVPAAVRGPVLADLLDILVAEVNVKTYQVVESDHELVSLVGKANFRSLGKRFGKATPQVAAAIAQLDQAALHALERGESVRIGDGEVCPEDVIITRAVASDWVVVADGPYVVALDPTVTPDLEQEGLAREVVNRVQRLRKEADYDYTMRIEVSVKGAADVVAAVEAFQGYVAGETLARSIQLGSTLDDADITRDVDIEGRAITLALRRHDARKGGTPR
jgi:isoleucyl-tRNA synthetase